MVGHSSEGIGARLVSHEAANMIYRDDDLQPMASWPRSRVTGPYFCQGEGGQSPSLVEVHLLLDTIRA